MFVEVIPTTIRDLIIVDTKAFADDRGYFKEAYHKQDFAKAGLPDQFVQANHSVSKKNVIRGLHFQWEPPMGKLMRVTRGQAFLVAVDLRHGSPTLGQYHSIILDEDDTRQIYAPAGFARGFCALSDRVDVQYQCTGTYSGSGESGIRWNDPDLAIDWPDISNPIISQKDRDARTISQWLADERSFAFQY